jgi:plastocyanin domain-containing protein
MKSNTRVNILITALAISGSCKAARAADDEKTPANESGGAIANKGTKQVEIAVTDKGFQPDTITVKKGQPVAIVFTRKTRKTCTKEVVLETSDAGKIQKRLPLNKPVRIKITFTKVRDHKYTCNMNSFSGTVIVQ